MEDEFHFLCKCPYLTNCREELYNLAKQKVPEFSNLNEHDKFITLMSNYNLIVANYLIKAWDLRKSKLYN